MRLTSVCVSSWRSHCCRLGSSRRIEHFTALADANSRYSSRYPHSVHSREPYSTHVVTPARSKALVWRASRAARCVQRPGRRPVAAAGAADQPAGGPPAAEKRRGGIAESEAARGGAGGEAERVRIHILVGYYAGVFSADRGMTESEADHWRVGGKAECVSSTADSALY